MTFRLLAARTLVRMAGLIVPRERSEWLAAMVGEFDELESSRAAVGWASGCLFAAIGWRFRTELPYTRAVLFACAASTFAYLTWWWVAAPSPDWTWVTVFQQATIVGATLAVSVAFPQRALISSIVIALGFNLGAAPRFAIHVMSTASSPEQAWSLAGFMALFIAENIWPALLAGIVVWGWDRAKRTRVAG
jgi:hypothetical protein